MFEVLGADRYSINIRKLMIKLYNMYPQQNAVNRYFSMIEIIKVI